MRPARGEAMRLLAFLVAAAVLAAAVPGASSDILRERNRAWMLDHFGDRYDPDRLYSGMWGLEGTTLRGSNVLERALDRLHDVDAADMAAQTVSYPFNDLGDVWLLGFGDGRCGPNLILGPSPAYLPYESQTQIYSGAIGIGHAEGFAGFSVGWTFKTSGTFGPEPIDYGPITDLFCFDGLIFFPYLDGTWWQ